MLDIKPLKYTHDIKLVMFDLDGTLVDSVPDLHAAVCGMLEDLDRPTASEDLVSHWVGNGAQALVKRALSNNFHIDEQLDETLFQQAYHGFLSHYQKTNGTRAKLFDGAKNLIDALKEQGIKVAIVTNKPEQFTLPLLEALELQADLVLSGDSLPSKKPDPAPLQFCLDHFQLSQHEAIMIGDSISDIKAARAAGVPVIAVSYGYNHGLPIRDLDADRVIDSLLELS